MAIVRRPTSKMSGHGDMNPEKAAEAFIQGAGATASGPAADTTRKTPIMLRFDPGLLRRVDIAAKRRGISRSAWIAFKVSEALDAEEEA